LKSAGPAQDWCKSGVHIGVAVYETDFFEVVFFATAKLPNPDIENLPAADY
jgi:hypothetical protein